MEYFHKLRAPGQFLKLIIPDGDSRVHQRSYSTITTPQDQIRNRGRVEFVISLVPNGLASTYLCELTPDSYLYSLGWGGHLKLFDEASPYTILTTGTGIAPILSILSSLSDGEITPATLHWCHGVSNSNQFDYFRSKVTHILEILKAWGWDIRFFLHASDSPLNQGILPYRITDPRNIIYTGIDTGQVIAVGNPNMVTQVMGDIKPKAKASNGSLRFTSEPFCSGNQTWASIKEVTTYFNQSIPIRRD